MEIALVCRYLTAERGGHERYLKRLVRGLSENDFDITVFSGAFDDDILECEDVKGVEVRYVRFPQWMRYLSFNKNAVAAISHCRRDFDVVFSTEYVTFGDIYRAGAGVARAELDGYGSIYDRLSLKNRVKMRLQKKLMQMPPKRIIVNSLSMQEEVIKYFHVTPERIAVIYNGIDTSIFSPEVRESLREEVRSELGLTEDDFVCIAVGANWKRKGIDRAVALLHRIADKNFKLLVIGVDEKKLRSMRGGDDERLIACGPTSSIQRYYSAADLCIVASRYDPAPNVILEALASALPVAASRECGLGELFEEERCGTLFRDNEELTGAVESVRESKNTRTYERMQDAAARLGQKFTMQRHVDKIIEELNKI